MEQLKKEAIRYLGYGKNAVDAQTLEAIEESFLNLQSAAGRKSIYRIFDLSLEDGKNIRFGNLEVTSKSLGKNLLGCDRIVLFGATLGVGVDQALIPDIEDGYGKNCGAAGMCGRASGRVLRCMPRCDRGRTEKGRKIPPAQVQSGVR